MRALLPAALAAALLLLACAEEEEPVADRYARQKAAIEARARALEAEVANEVAAEEARLANETDAILDAQGANAAEANAAAE